MSSVSGETTGTSGNNYISEYFSSTVVSVKPTTESLEIQQPSQDGRLGSPQSSSKVVAPLSPISSFDVTSEQHNGSLNNIQEFQSSSIPIKSRSDNSEDQNESSVNNTGSANSGQKQICRFYQKNGFCKFRNNCRHLHSVSDRPKAVKAYSYVEEKLGDRGQSSYEELDTQQEAREDDGNPNSYHKKAFVCKFFSRRGYCMYGDSCKFAHQSFQADISQVAENPESSNPKTALKNASKDVQNNSGVLAVDSSQSEIAPAILKSNKPCRLFYRNGDCRFGESCRYLHIRPKPKKDRPINTSSIDKVQKPKNNATEPLNDQKTADIHEETVKEQDEALVSNQNCEDIQSEPHNAVPNPVKLRNKKRSDMTQADFLKLRTTEISQLKRKYPKCTQTSIPEVGLVFSVQFFPSDPDWRFDVKSVYLNVMIPETYPEENLQVDLQNEEGILPEKLVRYFNKTTFAWLQDQQEMNKVSDEVRLIFRPFIKWLDKSLEDIFIGGLKMVKREMEAKAAGLEFVTHQELNTNNQTKKDIKSESNPIPNEGESSPPFTDYEDPITEYDDPFPHTMGDASSQSVLMENVVDFRSVTETPKRGTEIKLRNLELLDAAASLTCSKLSVTVQCGRCKMRSDVAVSPHRSHRIVCERCHHQQKLVFRPQMLHQFSSVAGYLDLDNCEVIDVPLLTCEFAIQCLPCGRQNFLSGVQYGQCHNTWCLFCHSKMVVSVESSKLNQLQPNIEPVISKAGQLLKLEKKEKRVKDPAVQEGKPLPENGICKHYKKSFRWLRFPCCGKTYPCDHCHDEKETDHEMKYATRMLCGFCAKEQPYSKDRPCTACASDMTKKTGTHWEGGKGCRDKIKMSRDDKQKYAGTNKTVAKKNTGTAPDKK